MCTLARPESSGADDLKRQFRDSRILNRLARTESLFHKIVPSWLRLLTSRLKEYPALIRKTAAGLQVGVDISKLFWTRWNEFQSSQVQVLFAGASIFCETLTEVADIVDRARKGAEVISHENRMSEDSPESISGFHPFSFLMVDDLFDPGTAEHMKANDIFVLGDVRRVRQSDPVSPASDLGGGKFFYYSPRWLIEAVDQESSEKWPPSARVELATHHRDYICLKYQQQIGTGTGFRLRRAFKTPTGFTSK